MEGDNGSGFDSALEDLLTLPISSTSGLNPTLITDAAVPEVVSTVDGSSPLPDVPEFALDLNDPASNALLGLDEPDYGKFENWIQGWVRPDKPCDYCRIRRIDCYYYKKGDLSCNPCISLFRECSLNSHTLEAQNYADGAFPTFLDTLHPVDETSAREQGAFTGIRPLASKGGRGNGRRSSSPSPTRADDAPGSSKRNGIRFPRHAVKILRDWLESHADHPYPNEDEKAELEQQTELKPNQIANWLANARRRRKVTANAKHRGCSSPSLKPRTAAMDIPAPEKPWDELNPFERWKNSPPENEPASVTDIAEAVANTSLPEEERSLSSSSYDTRQKRSSNGSNFSGLRAPSITSQETSQSSMSASAVSSSQTHGSMSSHGSSFGSFSSSLAGKRDRRRRKRQTLAPAKSQADSKKRIFQCTFCTDTFKSKYDWTRHEKSLHLSLEKWVCAPEGPVVTNEANGTKMCVYCGEENPSEDHIEAHNHRQCAEKGLDARTFFRKDHLRQHLRLMHSCELLPIMEPWKCVATHVNSRCGFCAKRFTVWQERVDHLTAHFKAGARMSEWKGCRGLDPAVAAQVTNGMPPYLIGLEQLSPVPFSASDRATWRCVDDTDKPAVPDDAFCPSSGYGQKTTCWERLTIRLGKSASLAAAKGIVLTDEMLQREARIILYESDDPWNTTAADNPEWLDLFKKAHGLDFIPSEIGGEGDNVPEDLETYGDLGLRIPFAVQLKAYNQAQAALRNAASADAIGNPSHPLEQTRRLNLQTLCEQLDKAGVLREMDENCGHAECAANTFDASVLSNAVDNAGLRRWCTYDLSFEKSLELLSHASSGSSSPTSNGGTSSATQRQVNLSQGLQTLLNLECRSHGEVSCDKYRSRQALASDLFAKEGVVPTNCPDARAASKKDFLQRHKYELSSDRAQRFATLTPAWTDSGTMPEPSSTALPSLYNDTSVSTGAIMEFLGGDLGQELPFSRDPHTSDIPLSDEEMQALNPSPYGPDWLTQEGNAQHESVMLENIDRLIAETSAEGNAQADSPTAMATQLEGYATTVLPPTTSATADIPMDLGMDEINFVDMNFDSVFDMSME